MRISDWSSDVCSSDLLALQCRERKSFLHRFPPKKQDESPVTSFASGQRHEGLAEKENKSRNTAKTPPKVPWRASRAPDSPNYVGGLKSLCAGFWRAGFRTPARNNSHIVLRREGWIHSEARS